MRYVVFIFIAIILNVNFAYADTLITDSTQNDCDFIDDLTYLSAVFERNVYDCTSGYYLPANHDRCEPCPNGHTCPGGTYTFNENMAQGITYAKTITAGFNYGCATNLIGQFNAVFQRNTYTCSAGTYLPANTDGCQTCPQNSYCAGGTYTFNETTDQGIVACASGLYSPVGSWEQPQCGRIFHVGDLYVYLRSTKITVPALHLDIDKDGTADFFGNMTRTPVPMNKDFENMQSLNKLVIEIREPFTDRQGNVVPAGKYYVYDDTVTVPQE